MADPVVRQIAFYWNNKKAITANKVKVSFVMNREPLFGQDGILAWSLGHAIMKLTVSGFTPVGGSFTSDDIGKILAQKDIPISFILGGKYYDAVGAVSNLDFDSDSERGTTMEEVQLNCRAPNITG